MTNEKFDAVAFMRRRRAEIDEEDQGLTREQRSIKTLKLLEGNPRWRKLRKRLVGRASEATLTPIGK